MKKIISILWSFLSSSFNCAVYNISSSTTTTCFSSSNGNNPGNQAFGTVAETVRQHHEFCIFPLRATRIYKSWNANASRMPQGFSLFLYFSAPNAFGQFSSVYLSRITLNPTSSFQSTLEVFTPAMSTSTSESSLCSSMS